MKTVFILAAVLVMLRVAGALIVLNQTLRLRIRRARLRPAADEELGPQTRAGLEPAIAELEALGFVRIGWAALEREGARDVSPRFHARLFHPQAVAYATASFSSGPDSVSRWLVAFSTYSTGDRVVQTIDGREMPLLGAPAGTLLIPSYAATVAEQWETHRTAVANVTPANLDPEAAFALAAAGSVGNFDSFVRDRNLLPAEGGAYVLSWPLALRASRDFLRAARHLKAQRAQRETLQRASQHPSSAVPLEEEVAAYERIADATSGRPRASFLLALLVITVPLYVAAGWYSTGAATTAAIVLAVVLFHELGHYLAMRALGYVDTTIFFVPFLGGVAAGRKDDATLSQRMVVLLAGPLPGLLLAIAVAQVHPAISPALRQAAILCVTINLFNLLPILPLDGGQIAHMLLFARRPWLDVASRVVAGVGLLALGFRASAIFLGVLGALMLVQLPRARRQAQLRQKVDEARIASPGEPDVHRVFRVLAETLVATLPFPQKFAVARTTLAQGSLGAPVRARELFGWLLVYGSVLGVGCLATFVSFRASADTVPAPRQVVHVEAEAALACTPSPPAGPDPGDATVPDSVFAGTGMFATTEALAAAETTLGAALPDGIFRSVGPALFVWTPAHRQDDAENDDSDWSVAMTADAQRVAGALGAAGAHAYGPWTTPTIECSAPDALRAQSIEDVLDEYLLVGRSLIAIPAPWAPAEGPTQAQKLARHTFVVAMAAREAVRMTRPSTSPWSLLTGRRANPLAELRRQQLAAAEAALAAERSARPIDEDVARLVLTRIGSTSPGVFSRVDEELRERLGATSRHERSFLSLTMKASRSKTRVRVELSYMLPAAIDGEMRPMQRWLCAQSCGNERLLLEGHKAEQVASP